MGVLYVGDRITYLASGSLIVPFPSWLMGREVAGSLEEATDKGKDDGNPLNFYFWFYMLLWSSEGSRQELGCTEADWGWGRGALGRE